VAIDKVKQHILYKLGKAKETYKSTPVSRQQSWRNLPDRGGLLKISLQAANAAIDEYLREIQKPERNPFQVSSRTRTEALLEIHGIIASTPWLKLWE
jgi:hypothetical protein